MICPKCKNQNAILLLTTYLCPNQSCSNYDENSLKVEGTQSGWISSKNPNLANLPKTSKFINLQIHFDKYLDSIVTPANLIRTALTLKSEVRNFIQSIDIDSELIMFDMGTTYATALFQAQNISQFWTKLSEQLIQRDFANASIVVCEGHHGWDDYILLQSYDGATAYPPDNSDDYEYEDDQNTN